MIRTPLALRDAELEQMSDEDLAALEDRLLLDSELDNSPRARFSAGRAVVWVLSAIGIGLMMSVYAQFPTEKLGSLNTPIYLGVVAVGILAGRKV